MPEIARFFGVIIRMYVEASAPHQDELLANWERLQAGRAPNKIAPLK